MSNSRVGRLLSPELELAADGLRGSAGARAGPPGRLPLAARWLGLAVLVGAVCTAGCKDRSRSWQPMFKPTTPLSTKRQGLAAVEVNGVIYALGGAIGETFQNSTEFARIQKDGSLGPWQAGPPLHEERAYFDAVYKDGWIYVMGGGNGPGGHHLLRSVERAKVQPDGTLSPWVQEPHGMVMPRRCNKTVLIDGSVYAVGGFGGDMLNSVEHAKLLPGGGTGEWFEEQERLTVMRYISGVKKAGDVVYVVGSHDQTAGAALKDVEWSKVVDEAGFQAWKQTSPLQVPRFGLGLVAHGGRLYAIGGLNGAEFMDSIEVAPIEPAGGLGAWKLTPSKLTSKRGFMAVLQVGDRVYSIGGGGTEDVEYATFSEAGELGSWFSRDELQAVVAKQEAAAAAAFPFNGQVLDVKLAPPYVYLLIRAPGKEDQWIAGPSGSFAVGDQVRFGEGAMMGNFYSKTLAVRFRTVLFVSEIQKVR